MKGIINKTRIVRVLIFTVAAVFISHVFGSAKPSKQTPQSRASKEKIDQPPFVPDEIIVKLVPEVNTITSLSGDTNNLGLTGLSSLDRLNKKHGVTGMRRIIGKIGKKPKGKSGLKAEQLRQGLLRIYKIKFKQNTDILKAIDEYQTDPNIEYVEPNYLYHTTATIPNDPDFIQQWGLNNTGQTGGTNDADIDAAEAWDIETGDPGVVIAVVDTGIDWDHPDLADNIWVNLGEVPNNGIDDDGNGFIDDYRGWDFVSVDNSMVFSGEDPGPEDNDPMDFHGHGTHVSGIIGAVGNNSIGMAGIAWDCKVMAVRAGFKSSQGSGILELSDTINALVYAADNGSNIINMSFGDSNDSLTMRDAIDYAYVKGVTLVAAAGNRSWDRPLYPAYYSNVIAVGATDHNDDLAAGFGWGSAYGYWVDLVAPGVNIYSTLFDNSYASWSGTSMATPHVCGLAGLILSANPDFSNEEVRQVLRISADDLGAPGRDKFFGYGRINAYNALQFSTVCVSRIESPPPSGAIMGAMDIIGSAYGQNFDHYGVYYGEGAEPLSWTQIGSTSYSPIRGGILESWDVTAFADGLYTIKLVVVDSASDEFVDQITVFVNNKDTDYVPDDFPTIQSAIDGSVEGDTIVVKPGVYYENIHFDGKGITLRSEQGPDVTVIDGGGIDRVITFINEWGANSVLEGFTIRNGTFSGNGGGIYCYNSSPKIENCTITENSTVSPLYFGSMGGGFFSTFSAGYDLPPLTISNCTITGNTASSPYAAGGGVCFRIYPAVIKNCTIAGNMTFGSYSRGAGIADQAPSTITDCLIEGNAISGSTSRGAGIYTENSSTITNCIIRNNLGGDGAGIYCSTSSPIITNCAIINNDKGVYCFLSSPTITNSTIGKNLAIGIQSSMGGSSPTIINSILWDNTAEIYLELGGTINIAYSDIEGAEVWPGDGNMNNDPLFEPGEDFYLSASSPCIDAGTQDQTTYPTLPDDDIEGDSRPYGTSYDMGADEYTIVSCTDGDGDGYAKEGGFCGPIDCDDTNRKISPIAREFNKHRCNDGIDNDCDGFVDHDDPDCIGTERNCKDGKDNDSDNLIDCADPDCNSFPWCS